MDAGPCTEVEPAVRPESDENPNHLGACLSNRRILLARARTSQILSCRMSKTFRPWKIDEPLFLPAMVQVWGLLFLTPHRQVVPRARRFHEHCGVRCAGFPYRRGIPQAAFVGVERAVYANPASVRDGRLGEARACRAR